jgi:hypothetical protein
MRARRAWLVLTAFVILCACGQDEKPNPQAPSVDPNVELQEGWAGFRHRDYSSARGHFEQVILVLPGAPEGYVGRGWCQTVMDSLEAAALSFEQADQLGGEPDGSAGAALVAFLLGNDELAADAAARVLSDRGYVFFGEPTFEYKDLVYIRAVSLFHLLRWEECYETLRLAFSWLEIDLDAYDFREQLFDAIERLGSAV